MILVPIATQRSSSSDQATYDFDVCDSGAAYIATLVSTHRNKFIWAIHMDARNWLGNGTSSHLGVRLAQPFEQADAVALIHCLAADHQWRQLVVVPHQHEGARLGQGGQRCRQRHLNGRCSGQGGSYMLVAAGVFDIPA